MRKTYVIFNRDALDEFIVVSGAKSDEEAWCTALSENEPYPPQPGDTWDLCEAKVIKAPVLPEDPELAYESHPVYLRAEKADADASHWHQGSGVHTCSCLGLVGHHLERASPTSNCLHSIAAQEWANAAEAEAAYLSKTNGEFGDFPDWKKSPSGIATEKAKEASTAAGVDAEELM